MSRARPTATGAGLAAGARRAAGLLAAAGLTIATAAPALAGAHTDVPVRPDRSQARAWAVEELAHREYRAGRPGLVARALQWLLDRFGSLPGVDRPEQALATAVLLALLVALAVTVWRRGLLRRQHRSAAQGAVFAGPPLTAAEHRELAERAASAGDWSAAVVERFRAIARELEERAVITAMPGRTADEVAHDAGRWLPALSVELDAAARLFDDVSYGGRPGSAEAAGTLRELDHRVRSARPAAVEAAMAVGPEPPS